MGVRDVWKGFSGKTSEPVRVPDAEAIAAKIAAIRISDRERIEMLDSFEESDIAWFWATDAKNRLTYLSPAAISQFAVERKIIGEPLAELFKTVSDEQDAAEIKPISYMVSSRSSFVEQPVELLDQKAVADGGKWWELTGRAQFNHKKDFIGYRGIAKDITSNYEQQLQTARLAEYDSLTGLANRHRMKRRLESSLNAYKIEKRSCALVMLDLDRFKQVNDTLGHPAGDELLRQVAGRLKSIAPGGAEIGRLGGDEFQLIIPDLDDRGRLGEIANRLIQMISQPYSVEGSRAIIGTSVGIAVAPYDGITTSELVKAADLALYAAKGGGRGQFRFYSNDLKETAEDRREIEEDLRDAIQAGQLEVHYQPQVQTKDQKLSGFEALVRWNHPEHGDISPSIFIPIAEESNLIEELGVFVMKKACKDAAEWPGELSVAVNVSARQFLDGNLPQVVERALEESGLAPSRLELEITETVFMGDLGTTDAMFSVLKKLGVRLALDDFGTGFSSMSYLSKAPFDKIKIDQSFVAGCTEKENSNRAIITAIASLARALGMATTAEGIEALDEFEVITSLEIDLVQGFIFSRAVPHEQVLEKLASGDFHYEAVGPAKHRAKRRTVYRRVGVVHEDHHYVAMLRDLSRTGAKIEGLLEVPVGTELVLDLGEGQLVVGKVRRSKDATQGLEFETPLVSDGAGGLCTRHRVSPYMLAAAGMPLQALPSGHHLAALATRRQEGPVSRPRFMQVEVGHGAPRAA